VYGFKHKQCNGSVIFMQRCHHHVAEQGRWRYLMEGDT